MKQHHKVARKRGVFKLKKGGPIFMPRGFGRREAFDVDTLLGSARILTGRERKFTQKRFGRNS